MFLQALIVAGVITAVHPLECILCMENSLDEFGECGSQFRYNCNESYPAHVVKNEKIFCRTTRKRELNNTYTITKECISETQHHQTFPRKDYPLEDECDLLEIRGSEVAYCLCRTERCNQKPIAEQFMSFEEKHPELFGDLDEDIPSTAFETEAAPKRLEVDSKQSRHSPSLPLSKASVVKAPELTPIMPVNDPRSIINDNALRRAQPSFEISKDIVDEGKGRSMLPSRGLDSSLSIHKINNGKLPAKEIEQLSPWSSARSLAEGPNPSSPIAVSSLRCMQCGEGGLDDAVTDCLLQASVSCKHEQSFCFTRHILIASGQNAVEKMCVSQEALVAEYGQSLDLSKREVQCTSLSGGQVRVCVCSDEDNCNQRNVDEQFALSPAARNSIVKASSPTLNQPVVPIDIGSELASSHAVAFNGIASSSLVISPDAKPIVPVRAEATATTTTTTRSPKVRSGVHCSACSSGDLSDPTADCPSATTMECMVLPGERSYCLTRQTQLSNGLFTMEKTCMTGLEFSDDFPDEKPAPGCGTAFDGLVNYCLCSGEMCNQDSLLSQAAENIPDAAAKNHRTTTTTSSRPMINQMKLHEQEPVNFAMEEDLEQPVVPIPSHKIAEIPDLNTRLIEPVDEASPEPSEEDKSKIQKMLREQQWKDETERLAEKSIAQLTQIVPLLLTLSIVLMR